MICAHLVLSCRPIIVSAETYSITEDELHVTITIVKIQYRFMERYLKVSKLTILTYGKSLSIPTVAASAVLPL